MAYVRMAQDFLEGTAERDLNAIIGAWEERHGPIIHKDRRTRLDEGRTRHGFKTSRLVETVDVHFEDSKSGRLVKVDHGSWKIEKNPDVKPAPVDPNDPLLTSPAVLKQAPNLLDSMRSRNTAAE